MMMLMITKSIPKIRCKELNYKQDSPKLKYNTGKSKITKKTTGMPFSTTLQN